MVTINNLYAYFNTTIGNSTGLKALKIAILITNFNILPIIRFKI